MIFLVVNISSDNGAKSMSVRSVSKHVEWSVRWQYAVHVPMGGRLYEQYEGDLVLKKLLTVFGGMEREPRSIRRIPAWYFVSLLWYCKLRPVWSGSGSGFA